MVRKIAWAVAVTAALAPTAATAAPTSTNVAKLCRALRSANPRVFRSAFATYGGCVSAHARPKRVTVRVTLKNVSFMETGRVGSAGAGGCELSPDGCPLTVAGRLTGVLTGTFRWKLTAMWTDETGNPATGFCAPTDGIVAITLPGLGTVTLAETGKLCGRGTTASNPPHTFTGTFVLRGGSGVFARASGRGRVIFTQQPGESGAEGGAVNGSRTFQALTIRV